MPRGLALTPASHELLRHARAVLDTVNLMANEMGDFAVGVRVWANTSAIIQFLPHDLAAFLQAQPLVRISLEEKLGEDVVAALSSGETDIGIFVEIPRAGGVKT
ncbi:transcriptional regulator, LysR-family [Pseudogulbenkiania ferrooxidans 2002]|uniref:Transcriptional regulator, LysR-family n=2 Tax=Pseudogulbenkiania ferrooxidans TaxID=549169 RepID=B9Z0N5_9NEIS|nr:transcriptional regulator, LysR-family [Pseudogulbenkiania ferrooxidans 2002]